MAAGVAGGRLHLETLSRACIYPDYGFPPLMCATRGMHTCTYALAHMHMHKCKRVFTWHASQVRASAFRNSAEMFTTMHLTCSFGASGGVPALPASPIAKLVMIVKRTDGGPEQNMKNGHRPGAGADGRRRTGTRLDTCVRTSLSDVSLQMSLHVGIHQGSREGPGD